MMAPKPQGASPGCRALGIDIGSTSIKGAVLDVASSVVQTPISRPFPAPIAVQNPGWVEIDPSAIMSAVKEVLSDLLKQAPDADRLCLSGQMGGLIMVGAQVRPLTNYISWRDQRTLASSSSQPSLLDNIRERWEKADFLTALGQELQPGSTTVLLAWLKANQQLPHRARPSTIGDFVVAQLAQHPVPMHATHAIGMLDMFSGSWHTAAFEALHYANDIVLPELAMTEACVGQAKIEGRTLELFGSYGDQQCALRGAGLERDELSLNVSTGSQVSRRMASFQPGPYQSRKYFFGDTLDTITHLPAGRSLNVLVDLLMELATAASPDGKGSSNFNPWDTINQKVSDVSDTDLELNLAFFRGPLGQRGHIGNITTENLSIGSLFLAAFRSMADNYATIAERFGTDQWPAVVLSGGLTYHAPRLRSLLAERFTAPLRESAGEETMLGLLDIARHSLYSTSHSISTIR